MKGNVVEGVGNLTGADSWQRSGKEEHAEGEGEYDAARAQGYVEGTTDRVKGKKDSVVGSITGDRSQEASGTSPSRESRVCCLSIYVGNVRHDKGETQQSINKHA